jgi:isocitrate dehydrogenase
LAPKSWRPLQILKEGGAKLAIERIDIGEKVYLAGNTSESNQARGIVAPHQSFKAPITTAGWRLQKSNDRKTLGLTPMCGRALLSPVHRNEASKHGLVIVRENEEDLYGHRMFRPIRLRLKIISRPGSKRSRTHSNTPAVIIERRSPALPKTTS